MRQSRETGKIGYTRRRQTKQKHNTVLSFCVPWRLVSWYFSPNNINANVDVKFSAHEAFLEKPASDTIEMPNSLSVLGTKTEKTPIISRTYILGY
jgi:hypothetical protein